MKPTDQQINRSTPCVLFCLVLLVCCNVGCSDQVAPMSNDFDSRATNDRPTRSLGFVDVESGATFFIPVAWFEVDGGESGLSFRCSCDCAQLQQVYFANDKGPAGAVAVTFPPQSELANTNVGKTDLALELIASTIEGAESRVVLYVTLSRKIETLNGKGRHG